MSRRGREQTLTSAPFMGAETYLDNNLVGKCSSKYFLQERLVAGLFQPGVHLVNKIAKEFTSILLDTHIDGLPIMLVCLPYTVWFKVLYLAMLEMSKRFLHLIEQV